MDTVLNRINAYILTGGQSRRFGEPKCLVKVGDKSLTEIVYDNLNTTFDDISLIGKENHFSQYHYIEDLHSIQCPMNGIATALDNSKSDWIFVLACDMPMINENIINDLYDNIDLDKQAVIPLLIDKLQPLCGFYNKSILGDFDESIKKKKYSLFKLLYQIDIAKIAIPLNLIKQFLNINYPKDLQKAEKLILL